MTRAMRWLPAALLVLLTLAPTGCKKEEAPAEADIEEQPAGSSLVVADINIGRALGADSRVVEEEFPAGPVFEPTDTIYVSVETTGSAPSATLTARWTFEDGQVVDETSRSIAPSGPTVSEFHIAKPDGWPAGGYAVAILLDGLQVAGQEFRVE